MTIHGHSIAYANFEDGDVALYIRNEIRSEEIEHATYAIIQSGSMNHSHWKNHDKLLIGVIDRSSSSTDLNNTHLLNMIATTVNKHFSNLMIMGDFNYPCMQVLSGKIPYPLGQRWNKDSWLHTETASYASMSHNQPDTEPYRLQTFSPCDDQW